MLDLDAFAKNKLGVSSTNFEGLDFLTVKGTLEAMDKAMNMWPQLRGLVGALDKNIGNPRAFAKTIGVGQEYFRVSLNPLYFYDLDKLKREYADCVENNVFPANTEWITVIIHELGHVAQGAIVKRNAKSIAAAIGDWNAHKTAKKITEEAWMAVDFKNANNAKSMHDAISNLSKNALESYSETIADAFSDVFSNTKSAQPLSREVVRILLKRLVT
jgi:hypothetical protein